MSNIFQLNFAPEQKNTLQMYAKYNIFALFRRLQNKNIFSKPYFEIGKMHIFIFLQHFSLPLRKSCTCSSLFLNEKFLISFVLKFLTYCSKPEIRIDAYPRCTGSWGTQILNGTTKSSKKCQLGEVPVGGQKFNPWTDDFFPIL